MNSVKLLHIKCCFFQFFNNTVALKNKKKCWPPRKSWNDAPALVPKFMLVSDEGSDQPWDNDWASWSSVLPQTRASAMKYMSMKNIEYALNTFFILYEFFFIFADLYPAVLLGRKLLILMWITVPFKLNVLYQIIFLNWHGVLQSNNYWS
jgi:hypothetical protein